MNNRWMCLLGLGWMTLTGCKRGPDAAAVGRCQSARDEVMVARSGITTTLLLEGEQLRQRSLKFRHWQQVEPRDDAGTDAGGGQEQEFHRFLLRAAQEARAMDEYTRALTELRAALLPRGDGGSSGASMLSTIDAAIAALGALRVQAEAANRAATPVLAVSYERQTTAYNRVLEGLAMHPENGSPMMDRLSMFESLAETGAILDADTEALVTTNCALDWSQRPALRRVQQGFNHPYRPYGTPSSLTLSEAQIRERLAEVQRRRAEVAEVTQRPAATLLPETSLAPELPRLRAAVERREQACRGIP